MIIPFVHLGAQPKVFDHRLRSQDFDMVLSGELLRPRMHDLAELHGRLTGSVTLTCDRCGADYEHKMDEKVTLLITDSPYKRKERESDEREYDIIEFLDGKVDLDIIIESEVNAIKYDYHKCSECSENFHNK